MDFVYKQKVVLTRGFYAGRKGRILEEMNKDPDHKSYKVEVDLGDEPPRRVEVLATDMKKPSFWDIIP